MLSALAIVAMSVLVGGVLGAYIALWTRPKAHTVPEPPVKPLCFCGHVRSMHEAGKDRCKTVTVDIQVLTGIHKVSGQCPCQFYDGPIPFPEYYAPEFLDE